ncbi:MAG: DUF4185 domain-containing protein [Chloroflexota bacterium]
MIIAKRSVGDARSGGDTAPRGQARRVGVLTGAGSLNMTEGRYDIKGTDLGIMWTDERGRVLIAFGDTFGSQWTGTGSRSGDPAAIDWRSNTLAFSRDYLAYMSVRHFGQPGHWITNYGGIAYSDDGGQTWREAPVGCGPTSLARTTTSR